MKVLHKGTFLLTLAWCIQLLVGYAINMWLAKYFGPEVIGTYGTVMTILVFIEVGVLSGFPTAIQKFISARNEDAVPVLKRVSQLQFVYVVALFCLSIMAAPFIAIILNDQSLSFYIRIAVIDLWLYSFFFIFLHLQNALHHFGKQAILIIIYGISKLCFVYLLVLKTQSITGALIANFVGSAIGLVFGIIFAFSERLPRKEGLFDRDVILRFATPIIFYTLAINLILNIDLWLVKKYFSQSAIPGYYYVAGILAKVPYYLFFGLNAAVLPYLSGALASGDHKVAHQTIRTACRILTIVIFPLAVLVTSYSHEIIVLFFSAEFFAGGDILRILFWGMALLAFHFLLSTILTADNKPKLPLIITLCILILSICFNLILIPKYGAIGAAIATTCSVFIGVLFSGTMVFKRFRTFIDLRSLGKIIFASLIIFFISLIVRANGLKIIFVCGVLLIIYLIFLIFLKELNVKKVINSIIDS